MKTNNIDFTPQYALLLDGLNEMQSALQESLVNELKMFLIEEYREILRNMGAIT